MKTISLIGVGGAGCCALAHLAGTFPSRFRLIGIDTDIQALEFNQDIQALPIGQNLSSRVFCKWPPELSRRAALEEKQKIVESIAGSDMVCAVASLGGGTGTGALPALLEMCKASGILTVAVVTTPFPFEGRKRAVTAINGLSEVEMLADLTIWIPYECLYVMLPQEKRLKDIYRFADDVIEIAVKGITSLFQNDKKWILDGGDVENLGPILASSGRAVMGFGSAVTLPAAMEGALKCPLLGSGAMVRAGKMIAGLTVTESTALSEIDVALDLVRKTAGAQVEELVWSVTGTDTLPAVVLYAAEIR